MTKKAELVLGETVKIVLAVIGIAILIFLSVKLYGVFVQNTEGEQALIGLDKISLGISGVENGESENYDVLIESPNKWWILAWPFGSSTEKPAKCEKDNCICICAVRYVPTLSRSLEGCDLEGVCEDVDKRIKTFSDGKNGPIYIEGPISINIKIEDDEFIIEKNE